MSVIINFVETVLAHFDLIVACAAAGLFGHYFIPHLIVKMKDNGIQPVKDVTEAISESVVDYKNAIKSMDEVVEDITVNDADTLEFVKNTLKTLKSFK